MDELREQLEATQRASQGDGHLGGYKSWLNGNIRCNDTFYPTMLDYLVKRLNIKSALDIGCAEGLTVQYLQSLGLWAYGFDGHPAPIEASPVPGLHVWDLQKGPFQVYTQRGSNFSIRYDLGVCIEVVEHIDPEYLPNLLDTFEFCDTIVMTHAVPGQGGYHHVNCQMAAYWLHKMHETGFDLDKTLTEECRKRAHHYFERTGLVFRQRLYPPTGPGAR